MLSPNKNERPKHVSAVINRLNQINNDLLQATIMGNVTQEAQQRRCATYTTHKASPSTDRRPSHYGIAIAGFSLILFVFFALLINWQPAKKPTPNDGKRFVVALEPIINLSEQLNEEQQNVIVASVDDAIIQTLLSLDTLSLIDRQQNNHDLLHEDLNFTKIGQQVGADELISSQINCTQQRCQVSINRINVADGNVITRLQNYLPRRSAFQLFQDTQNMMSRLFANELPHTRHNNVPVAIGVNTAQAYQQFASIYAQVKVHGNHSMALLTQLHHLIEQGYTGQQAHILYRKLALILYDDRKEASIIANFIALLENASDRYRDSVYFAIDKFWIALYQGQYSDARQAITLARLRKADSYQIMRLQAAFYLQQNEFEQAAQYFSQLLAMRIDVDDLYNLALSHWFTGDRLNATLSLQQLLELEPSHYSANQLMASIFLIQGDLSQAISTYQQLIEQYAYSMDLSNLALAYMLERNYTDAIDLIKRALNQSGNNAALHLNLADALNLSGQAALSAKHYQRVLTLNNPSDGITALLEVAQAHAHLGNTIEAIHALNKATN